jgi:hypothetical protein
MRTWENSEIPDTEMSSTQGTKLDRYPQIELPTYGGNNEEHQINNDHQKKQVQ